MVTEIPLSLLDDLNYIPRDRPVALLMRHSARFPIPDPALTFEIGLTEEGVRLAEDLGSQLKDQFQPGRMMAAPVGRCLATAEAIARGAGWPVQVQPDERLSHPFIAPAWHMVEDGVFPKLLPFQIRVTLKLLLQQTDGMGHLDIMVTHDTVVGAVIGGLLRAPVLGPDWPNFLEGVFFWKVDTRVYTRWRGIETVFNEQFARVE